MNENLDKVLAVDASLAGISGDMFISALLGLFENYNQELKLINDNLTKINPNLKLIMSLMDYKSFQGHQLKLIGNNEHLEMDQLKSKLNELIKIFNLSQILTEFSNGILDSLVDTETKIHQTNDLHLHELGTYDTLIDICVSAYLIQELKISKIQLSPVALGQGTFKSSHGILPVPGPAVQSLVEENNLITCEGPKDGEASTPTGIAILVNLQKYFGRSINTIWQKSSLGFGSKKWVDRGNYLRLRLGESTSETSYISILETNIDDLTGEKLGFASDKLLEAGALDVSYYPIFMKKNRPAYCLRVLCKTEETEHIAELIQLYTGTLGIREINVNRHLGNRQFDLNTVTINERKYEIRVKMGKYNYKIEFDDLVDISNKENIPINKLEKEIYAQLKQRLDEEKS